MDQRNIVAAVVFGALEAYLPMRALMITVLFWFGGSLDEAAYFTSMWGISLVLGGVIAWLIFVRWQAKFEVKLTVAAVVFVVTFAAFSYLAIGPMQQVLINTRVK